MRKMVNLEGIEEESIQMRSPDCREDTRMAGASKRQDWDFMTWFRWVRALEREEHFKNFMNSALTLVGVDEEGVEEAKRMRF